MSTTPNDEPSASQQPQPPSSDKPILLPEDLTIDNFNTPEGSKKLQEFIANPELASRALKAIALTPDAQKDFRDEQKRLNLPYYKEGFARELIREVLDPMIADGQVRCFHKDDFRRWSMSTLGQKVRQAFDYACRYLDHPDRRYTLLREKTVISSEKNQVVIFYKKDMGDSFKARIYKDRSTVEDVLEVIKQIVEKGDFNISYTIPADDSFLPFYFDEREQNRIKEFCAPFPFIMLVTSAEQIKVVKIDKGEAK